MFTQIDHEPLRSITFQYCSWEVFVYPKDAAKGKKWAIEGYGELSENSGDGIINKR